MRIYKDIISGDELCSDSYPMKVVDDVLLEFTGKVITQSDELDPNLLGSNPSQEGGEDEGGEYASRSGVNFVLAHNLVETSFDKKGYMVYIKDYMKSLVEKLNESNPSRVAIFKKQAQEIMKSFIIPNFDDFQFFQGEGMNPEAMVILVRYEDDVPKAYLFKDGALDEKY